MVVRVSNVLFSVKLSEQEARGNCFCMTECLVLKLVRVGEPGVPV